MAQRQAFQGGGKDASTKSFTDSYNKQKGTPRQVKSYNKPTTFDQDSEQVVADITNSGIANIPTKAVGGPPGFIPKYSPEEITEIENQKTFYNVKGDYPSYIPSWMKAAGNFSRKPNRKFFYEKVLGNNSKGLNYTELQKAYEEYMSNRMSGDTDAYGNDNPFVNDYSGSANILPYPYNLHQPEEVVEDEVDNSIAYRMGNTQGTGKDVTDIRGYAANGGIMGLRARRAFGGIMDRVTGRRAYGLGSIFKSVKKAVSKVLKSPIGKAAMLGAVSFGIPGTQYGGLFGKAPFSTGAFSKKGSLASLFRKKLEGDAGYGGLDWKKALMVGTTALPFIPGPWNEAKPNESLGRGGGGGSLIDPMTGVEAVGGGAGMRETLQAAIDEADGDPTKLEAIDAKYNHMLNLVDNRPYPNYVPYANGGRIGAEEGGLMNLGGMEKDYRAEGGFVPIGEKEKADDVPARLSVNEFVFTADAVRGAGGGDIDQGAEIMENVMKNLEAGGKISAETQGNTGAQEMFSVSERLGEVI